MEMIVKHFHTEMGASGPSDLCCMEMIVKHFHTEMGASALLGLCCKEKVIRISIRRWAHPSAYADGPGYPLVSFAACGVKRIPLLSLARTKTASRFWFCGVCAARKLLGVLGWSLGFYPKLRKPKRSAFWFPLRGSIAELFAAPRYLLRGVPRAHRGTQPTGPCSRRTARRSNCPPPDGRNFL
jgi:hypothetical protein